MTEKAEDKVETLPDLDDLLQCPVCYEIPSGQIFQCNEGHHVCGRCKMRLDVCPVCRAFFFGTRNYAMEELIANVRKLRAFKLGGKVTTGSPPAETAPEARESSSEEESTPENANEEEENAAPAVARPTACSGLFRCLCCKHNPERLPIARLLNHIRYYHSPDLIEGRSENGGYLQAWQFPTVSGRVVTAVRVHDMGIFFLVIEVTQDSVHAWLSMAASPWVAQEFSYSFTLSGNDREAIFSDCVWSVRSCEGSLKRRGRCLCVSGEDARALLAPASMSGKLSVRRTPRDLLPHAAQPRAVLRVANRSAPDATQLEPFLQGLQDDVARLSRAFATLGREANALARSEAEMRARLDAAPPSPPPAPAPAQPAPPPPAAAERQLSRSARRRMRQRLREAFREGQAPEPRAANHEPPRPSDAAPISPAARPAPNTLPSPNARPSANSARAGGSHTQPAPVRPTNGPATNAAFNQNRMLSSVISELARGLTAAGAPAQVAPPPVPPPNFEGPSHERPSNGNSRNKKKRRQRR